MHWVSVDRILEVENQLATAVCQDIEKRGVVCPAQLRKGLVTIGALDNVDHNTSSTTAKGSFHGTSISLFQSPTNFKMGHLQEKIKLTSLEAKKRHVLPGDYTVVPAVALKKNSVMVPKPPNEIEVIEGHLRRAQAKENCWLEHAIKLMEKEKEMVSLPCFSEKNF